MQRKYWLTFSGIFAGCLVFGQVKRQFNVENSQNCDIINLIVKANNGNCFIKPSQESDILNVFSNHDDASFSHQFLKEIKNKTCEVRLSLAEPSTDGFSQTISTRVFGGAEKARSGKFWKMYLTDSKPYMLDLNYGMGDAHVDLSGLAIKKLKINTGSADVDVGFYSLANKVDMDTFFVKVDVGSILVKHLNMSHTQCVMADVGFGNMTLDLSDRPVINNRIKGSVGAGNLVIILPKEGTPVLVKIHDSWLCSVSMTKNLKKIAENTFANDAYTKSPKTGLTFDLDVSMGSIVFKESPQ